MKAFVGCQHWAARPSRASLPRSCVPVKLGLPCEIYGHHRDIYRSPTTYCQGRNRSLHFEKAKFCHLVSRLQARRPASLHERCQATSLAAAFLLHHILAQATSALSLAQTAAATSRAVNVGITSSTSAALLVAAAVNLTTWRNNSIAEKRKNDYLPCSR